MLNLSFAIVCKIVIVTLHITRRFAACPRDRPGGEGLAARLSRHVKENTKLIAVYDCDTIIATVYCVITAQPYAHK